MSLLEGFWMEEDFLMALHQAIEAKENVKVEEENQTLASITYQNYFRLYRKISRNDWNSHD